MITDLYIRGEGVAKRGNLTPLMAQYYSTKEKYKDCILLYRIGDFYETFDEDAVVTSKALDIVLTARQGTPLAGIPYHALDSYLGKLVKKGHKVAICEQTEDPKLAKGLVRREVVRLVTPGTLIEDVLLDQRSNNYLSAIYIGKGSDGHHVHGIATADISTGDFFATELGTLQDLQAELSRIRPAECLMPHELMQNKALTGLCGSVVAQKDEQEWAGEEGGPAHGATALKGHFKVPSLQPFGCEDRPSAVAAAGLVLDYIQASSMGEVHIEGLRYQTSSRFMSLDASTMRNLELVQNIRNGGIEGTLLEVLDRTVTPMGARLLRRWLLQPLLDLKELSKRHDAVEAMTKDLLLIEELEEVMKGFHDLERLTSKIQYGSANARNLLAVKNSLRLVGNLKGLLRGRAEAATVEKAAGLFRGLAEGLNELNAIVEILDRAIVDEPPTGVKDGGMIKPGHSEELDGLNASVKDARDWISGLEKREKERSGIKTLRVGFNNVFGYYIEVSRAQADRVPQDYMRKQTLVNAERFITEELKRYEELVLSADEKIKALEFELFDKIRLRVAEMSGALLKVARTVAEIDVLRSLADVAVHGNYVRPALSDGTTLVIKDGRHPVIETKLASGEFVPNDTIMDCEESQLIILTGPNMAGKSTYMRQVALIAILAQMGSFVPAREATIGLVDKVFTRVGASDDLARGQSTFMVEMVETATILHTSTKRSLVLLDEIGRGTATFDGLSLAWAVAEELHNDPHLGGKTIFATHYHQLTELTKVLPRAKNFHMPVKEQDDELVFLRKVLPGSVDKSYGIQVAKLAGIPHRVIDRAKEVLESLEAEELVVLEESGPDRAKKGGHKVKGPIKPSFTQLVLFSDGDKVTKELSDLDLGNMTPLEALNKLSELQRKAKEQRIAPEKEVKD
jgi:DNA mismatch repair protein MutS